MDEQECSRIYQQTFVPSIHVTRLTARHSLGKLRLATAEMPTQLCGMAQRIGYTGRGADDLAIYRLKIHLQNGRYMTLSDLFVVEQGKFLLYENWLSLDKRGTGEQCTEAERVKDVL